MPERPVAVGPPYAAWAGEFNNRRDEMSSRGKKKTTMAKLSRESKLRERRLEKQAKKDARKHTSVAHPSQPDDTQAGEAR